MIRHVNVPMLEEEYQKLTDWKSRVEEAMGDRLAWLELFLLYANNPKMIPKRRKSP